MLQTQAHLADLFRILGLNHKFLSQRLSQLRSCPSFELPHILSLFPHPSLQTSIQRFLCSHFITHTPQQLQSMIDTIAYQHFRRGELSSQEKLGIFFGGQQIVNSIRVNSHPTELQISGEAQQRVICVFEQMISNFRRVSAARQRLKEVPTEQLMGSLEGQRAVELDGLVDYVQKYCAVDDGILRAIAEVVRGRVGLPELQGFLGRREYRRQEEEVNQEEEKDDSFSYYRKLGTQNSINNGFEQFAGRIARRTDKTSQSRNLDESINHQHLRFSDKNNSAVNIQPTNTPQHNPRVSSHQRTEDREVLSMTSPSLVRLRNFEDKIKQMQYDRTQQYNIRRNVNGAFSATPPTIKKGKLNLSQNNTQSFHTLQTANEASPPQPQQNYQPIPARSRSPVRVQQSPTFKAENHQIFLLTCDQYRQQQPQIQITQPPPLFQQIIQQKNQQINHQREIRTILEQQIQRSRQQLSQLRQLLEQQQRLPQEFYQDMRRARVQSPQPTIPNPNTYTIPHYPPYEPPLQRSISRSRQRQRDLSLRQVGRIKTHNIRQGGYLRHEPTINQYHYERVARRCRLERQFMKHRIENQLDRTRTLYR